MSDKTVKCPRCKCYRTEEDFIKEGRRLKTCINCRSYSKKYRLKRQMCTHNLEKYFCKDCGGTQICKDNKQIYLCRKCSDPISVSIRQWIFTSKQSDKKRNHFDADRFIDKCFLKELVKDYRNCYYCEVELQYVDNNDTLATIERLNNKFGHTKSNCVLACRQCNLSRVGQKNL